MNKAELVYEKQIYTLKTDKTYKVIDHEGLDQRCDEFVIEIEYDNGMEISYRIIAQTEEGEEITLKDESGIYFEINDLFCKLRAEGGVAV